MNFTLLKALGLFLSLTWVSMGRDVTCPELDDPANAPALDVLAETFQYTVTNISPGWFNFENSGDAPLFFQIRIHPNLAGLADGRLRLGVYIAAEPLQQDNTGQATYVLLDELYQLGPEHVGGILSSSEVFDLTAEPGGISGGDSELQDLLSVGGGRIPPLNLSTRFRLTCDNTTYTDWLNFRVASTGEPQDFSGNLRYVESITALSPGTPISSSRPVDIFTITPTFLISSNLYNSDFDYGNEPKFTLMLYEVYEGETPQEAMDGLELLSIEVGAQNPIPPIPYPSNAPLLEPGKSYVWRARANLRGPTSDFMYSNAMYFKVSTLLTGDGTDAPYDLSEKKNIEEFILIGDDYNRRLFAALKIILGENFDIFMSSLGQKQPIKGHIRWNGQPYSLDQLEKLAKEFLREKHVLTRVRFQ